MWLFLLLKESIANKKASLLSEGSAVREVYYARSMKGPLSGILQPGSLSQEGLWAEYSWGFLVLFSLGLYQSKGNSIPEWGERTPLESAMVNFSEKAALSLAPGLPQLLTKPFPLIHLSF